MILITTLKKLCDLIFYLTFASFVGIFFGGTVLMGALPILGLITFLSLYFPKRRYVPFLLLGLLPVMVPMSVANWVILFPAILYLFLGAKKVYRSEEIQYYDKFFAYGVAFLFLFVSSYAMGGIGANTGQGFREQPNVFTDLDSAFVFSRTVLPFGLMFVPSAIFLMRLSRHDNAVLEQPRFKWLNFGALIGLLLLGMFLSSPQLLNALDWVQWFIGMRILVPLLLLIMRMFAYLMGFLFGTMETPDWSLYVPEMENPPGVDMSYLEDGESSSGMLGVWIALVILIPIVVAALVFIVKFFLRIAQNQSEDFEVEEDGVVVERVTLPKTEKLRKKKRGSTGHEIRESYRKFLEVCQKKGVAITPQMTSLEVEELAQMESGELRALYLKTRYGEQDFTKEEALAAKKIVKALSREDK